MSRQPLGLVLWSSSLLLCACWGYDLGTDTGNPALPDFVADNPAGEIVGSGSSDSGELGGAGDDAARLIAQAERVQLAGDRLYGLTDGGTLFVVDVAQPEQLRLLGRHRLDGQPAGLWIDADAESAVVLLNTLRGPEDGRWAAGEGWAVAIDVSDPAQIAERARLPLPGTAASGFLAGSELYAISLEGDPYCAGCATDPVTVVTAIDATADGSLRALGEARVPGWPSATGFGERRIYLAHAAGEQGGARLDVVDAAAGGAVARGASVPLAGTVARPSQIDEQAGVLRVIGEDGQGGVLETFRVLSSQAISPLARLGLPVPPEMLATARFAGDRAYVATVQQHGPVVAIDLADPARPRIAGELALQGYVQRLEPRGDRLFALAIEPGQPAGVLSLALVDAAAPDALRLLSRVRFAQTDGAEFPREQEREAELAIDEARGLVLVPYKSWSRGPGQEIAECTSTPAHGVQLIELTGDTLRAAGSAAVRGSPRRAFVHRDRLLSVSNERVQSFDVQDRAAPRELSGVGLGRFVYGLTPMGDKLVRLTRDAETHRDERLEVVPLADPESAEPLGEIALDPLREGLPPQGRAGEPSCLFEWTSEVDGFFAYADYVYLLTTGSNQRVLSVFDFRDPAAPRFVRFVPLAIGNDRGHSGDTWMTPRSQHALLHSGLLVIGYTEVEWDSSGNRQTRNQPFFALVDLREPGEPRLVAQIARPDSLDHGGLHAAGPLVVSTRLEATADPREIKIFLDRLHLGDPDAPRLLPPLSVPGFLVDYDQERGELVTLDVHVGRELGPSECGTVPVALSREDACYEASYSVSLLELREGGAVRTSETPLEGVLTSIAASPTRVAVARVDGPLQSIGELGLLPGQPVPPPPASELVAFEREDGELEPGGSVATYGLVYGLRAIPEADERFMLHRAGVFEQFDARTADAPRLAPFDSASRGSCYVATPPTDPSVLCLFGPGGLEHLELGE